MCVVCANSQDDWNNVLSGKLHVAGDTSSEGDCDDDEGNRGSGGHVASPLMRVDLFCCRRRSRALYAASGGRVKSRELVIVIVGS